MNIKFKSELLWNQFLDEFKNNVNFISDKKSQLKNKDSRTKFYNQLFKKIFEGISLKYDKNQRDRFHFRKERYDRVDFSLIYQPQHHFHTDARWEIPVILIESENNANPDSNYREVEKLCHLNAPLKILFLCTSWNDNKNDNTKKWRRGDIIEGYWSAIIEGYAETIGVHGIFAVFVLDIEESVFYYHKLIQNGIYNNKTQSELNKCSIHF